MKYLIHLKVTGYVELPVHAESLDEAYEAATKEFEKYYMQKPIADLRWKVTEPKIQYKEER